MAQIDRFLHGLIEQKASDLHLTAGSRPVMRRNGELVRFDFREMTPDDVKDLLYEIMSAGERLEFEQRGDLDFAHELPDLARFRVNLFQQRKGMGAVLRTIPNDILSADDLALPPVIRNFCQLHTGLAPQQEGSGQPAADRDAYGVVRIGAARGAARGSGRDPGG